jgi:hypothetical protein
MDELEVHLMQDYEYSACDTITFIRTKVKKLVSCEFPSLYLTFNSKLKEGTWQWIYKNYDTVYKSKMFPSSSNINGSQ